MIKIRILWIGKTKERYLKEGIDRYLKLLSPALRVSIAEIKEEKGSEKNKLLSTEGKRILKQSQSYILLDDKGREFTSVEFASFLKKKDSLDFVVGGPFGVSGEIMEKAADIISLSKMTLTHEMARLLLLEQIYRAVTIIKGRGYHH